MIQPKGKAIPESMLSFRILLSSEVVDVFHLAEGVVNASENFSHSRCWITSSVCCCLLFPAPKTYFSDSLDPHYQPRICLMLKHSPSMALLVGSDTQLSTKHLQIKYFIKLITGIIMHWFMFIFCTLPGLILEIPNPLLLIEMSRDSKFLAMVWNM